MRANTNWKNIGIYCFLSVMLISCGNKTEFSISRYYDYDRAIPLQDSVSLVLDTTECRLYDLTYRSIHNKRVTGLLAIPNNTSVPPPVIILLHGLGDEKTVDYIEYGNQYFIKNGYAVLRIDIANHGSRIENKFDFDFTGKHKYWTRNIITQTVFDLRRAVDFINSRDDLDSERIGYFGVSLGGIIGTIFCGVEPRVKVPVLVIAGGQMNIMFEEKALASSTNEFLSIMEPINFVAQISPRPLLMLNAENDDIIPPMMTKLLYNKAKNPKKIIWYTSKHHDIPLEGVYREGTNWYDQYLSE